MATTLTMEPWEQAGTLVGYANGQRYRRRGDWLFADVPFAKSHVLEVGCGAGAWAIWAALHGAERVLGIEPEVDGSTANVLERFRSTITTLELGERVEAADYRLQDLRPPKRPFDIVIMYNVINHLDEEAVTVLQNDPRAFKQYVELLQHLRTLMQRSGWVIVADCARDNLWPRLGLRAPLAPSIEWQKHQNPAVWKNVFQQAGFRCVDLRWSPLQPLLRLTANWLVQYMTCSHFVLRFQMVESG